MFDLCYQSSVSLFANAGISYISLGNVALDSAIQ